MKEKLISAFLPTCLALYFLMPSPLAHGSFNIEPGSVKQGETVRLLITGAGIQDDTTILFEPDEGLYKGLLTIDDAALNLFLRVDREAHPGPRVVTMITGDEKIWQGEITILPESEADDDPAPVPPVTEYDPVLTKIQPENVTQGETVTLTVSGEYIAEGAGVIFLPDTGLDIKSAALKDDALVVTVSIDSKAAPGFRDVKVINPGGSSGFLTKALEILAPTALSVKAAAGSDGLIELEWEPVPVEDFLHYAVYVSESDQTDTAGLTPAATIDNISTCSYRLADLSPDLHYWFAVTAVDSAGLEYPLPVSAAPYRIEEGSKQMAPGTIAGIAAGSVILLLAASGLVAWKLKKSGHDAAYQLKMADRWTPCKKLAAIAMGWPLRYKDPLGEWHDVPHGAIYDRAGGKNVDFDPAHWGIPPADIKNGAITGDKLREYKKLVDSCISSKEPFSGEVMELLLEVGLIGVSNLHPVGNLFSAIAGATLAGNKLEDRLCELFRAIKGMFQGREGMEAKAQRVLHAWADIAGLPKISSIIPAGTAPLISAAHNLPRRERDLLIRAIDRFLQAKC